MLETSTFGIANGSLFSSLGTENTFEGAPAILNQRAGYTSAVFHGGSASFWNRDNVYKSLGYNDYFSGNFYNHDEKAATEYGIKDKLMMAETPKYLEHLQQPFYAKIITTSNHNPFISPKLIPIFLTPVLMTPRSTVIFARLIILMKRSRNSSTI